MPSRDGERIHDSSHACLRARFCLSGTDLPGNKVTLVEATGRSVYEVGRGSINKTEWLSRFEEDLVFDGRFESGNLRKAVRVRHNSPGSPTEFVGGDNTPFLDNIHQEYNLWCENDTSVIIVTPAPLTIVHILSIQTKGNIQWYFFSVKNNSAQEGLTVRFNFVNMMKKDSLYNYGMKPCVFSAKANEECGSDGWFHGGTSICYYRNNLTYSRRKKEKAKSYYTFTFTYQFQHPDDVVFFAHSVPLTYSDLQRDLDSLEDDEFASQFIRRRELCRTIAGNRCDLLTITAFNEDLVTIIRGV